MIGSQHLGDFAAGISQAVSSQHIYDSAISTQHFAASGIPAGAIADSAISSRHLATGSVAPVSSQHIRSSGIVANLISDAAVGSRALSASAITANHISDSVVGTRAMSAGAVGSFALSAGAVVPAKVGYAEVQVIGFPAVSNTGGVYSRASVLSASSVNSTVGPGTNLDYPRNVIVKFTPASGSSGLWSGGTIVLSGVNIVGASVSESFAVTGLNTKDTAGQSGTVVWAAGPQPATISFSNVSLHTDSSSASSDFSFHVGFGAKAGLPYSVAATNHVLTMLQSSATTAFTVHTGAAGTAGIEAAYAATRMHLAFVNKSQT